MSWRIAALRSVAVAGALSACAASPSAPRDVPAVTSPARVERSAAFVHPGILVNRAMLDFVKAKIAAQQQPWLAAFQQAQSSKYGRLDYVPHPREVVDCGSYSNPDHGCSEEKDDVLAAYTHALLWAYTGTEAHAKKAIEVMNAWSVTLREHTNRNAPLQAAWAAEVFPRAAEIIRYTYAGWPAPEQAQFTRMLREVYLPLVAAGSGSNGNWELSMIEAMTNIAVFSEDGEMFERALMMWRERTPAYLYFATDGPTPLPPPRGSKQFGELLSKFWYGQTKMFDGLCQETCRDLHHVQFGLAALVNTAETAYLQGVDLYGEQAARLEASLEFHAKLLNGASVPSDLCGGALSQRSKDPSWEIAFNHFVNRKGERLPQTEQLLTAIRPTGSSHHMAWETLTHAGVGFPH